MCPAEEPQAYGPRRRSTYPLRGYPYGSLNTVRLCCRTRVPSADMKSRRALLVVAVMFGAIAHVYGLNPPSKADGPIKLLTCAVDPRGMLDAEVENQTDDTLNCNI